MKQTSLLVLILCLSLINCSTAEESDSSVTWWLERVTFTGVQWDQEAGSCVVSSDWISMQRAKFKNAIIRKNDWWYEITIRDKVYLVKENPLDYLK